MAGSLARIVIVGGAGEVGRLVGRIVDPDVAVLEVVDPRSGPARSPRSVCARSDVMDWLERSDTLLCEADCVVLAVPEDVALRALHPLAEQLPAGALLVDTLSVKRSVVTELNDLPESLETLSLNPMFAPVLDLHGQPVLAVEVNPGARSQRLLELIRLAGCRVVQCEAEYHDRKTASLQALTHAAILSFGAALAKSGADPAELIEIAPPPFVAIAALLARILAGRSTTYYDIQASNEHAQLARDLFADAGHSLQSAIDAGPAGFSAFLLELAEVLGPEAAELERQAQQMLEAQRGAQPKTPPTNGHQRLGRVCGPLVSEVAEGG
ncbi:MAG TPA: prephenate dehydrogenase/arogenate dehydrogenase family protein [Solirubrobacterales bacterium]|nr:prephenate dehydrogenase/arogenate dehydrogenase family protein [Solirubrobacterales bacterium]